MPYNLEPITRKEQFYDNIIKSAGGGGGGSATLIEKTITINGEYNASSDNADGYSSVTVNVPSGGETFEVEIDFDSNTQKLVANRTIEDVVTAYNQGIVLIHLTETVVAMIRSGSDDIIISDYPVFNAKGQVDTDMYKLYSICAVTPSSGEYLPLEWAYSSDYTTSEISI